MRFRVDRIATLAFAIVAIAILPSYAAAATDLGPGAISAFVRDDDGKPVAGALVTADGPTTREATTSVAGIVTLLALPIGTYDVNVTRSGYAPLWRRIRVSSDPQASVLYFRAARSRLAEGVTSAANIVRVGDEVTLGVAQVIAATPDASLVAATAPSGGAAPTLLGTTADETRVELDGIPLAGGGSALTALRLRTTAGLDTIAFEKGPVVRSSTVRGAIGGVIDYRTAALRSESIAVGDVGYSSTFGAFEHVLTTRSIGSLAIAADVARAGGGDRSEALKARYAFSRTTSFDLATYALQSVTAATVRGGDVVTSAPVYAAGMRTSLGRASLQARAFSSSLSTSTAPNLAGPAADSADRIRGFQASLSVPAGRDEVAVSFDRRSEYAAYLEAGTAHTAAQTFTSFGASGTVYVSRASRLELADQFSGGTNVAPRHDPQLAFEMHPSDRLTIRASLGKSFTTVPTTVRSSALATRLEPETAFGYRVGVDDAVTHADVVSASVFDLRRFDRFATYASARTLGLDVAFHHEPVSAGFGGSADVTFARARAFGTVQPLGRRLDVLSARSLFALEGDPYYRLHSSLRYRSRRGASLTVRSTLFGANNALASHALGFIEASGSVPISRIAELRVGENNVFGTVVEDPLLAPYFVPHEYTVDFALGMRPEQSPR